MAAFLLGLMKLVIINVVLSGDNAVVIALACRNLPESQRRQAVFWGSFGAIGLRIVLTRAAVWLLAIPYVQAAGGLLLALIALKLLKGEEGEETVSSSLHLGAAIRTILFTDLIMSLDNVLAVAGAASGSIWLIAFGLAASIPLIIAGSGLLMRLMRRFPIIVTAGAGLLGYTAGEMVLGDPAVGSWFEQLLPFADPVLPVGFTLFVAAAASWGKLLETAARRRKRLAAAEGEEQPERIELRPH